MTAPDMEEPLGPEKIIPDDIAKDLVQLFKLLSDETRLRILVVLKQQGELNVQSLCQLLDQSQPAVSHHLALLRVAGLIDMRRAGKNNFYRIVGRRFHELMEMFFQVTAEDEPGIRFADNLLSYTPINDSNDKWPEGE